MKVKIYQNSNGDEPFVAWLESLRDITTRLRINKRLRRIEENNLGDVGVVGAGVHELRMHFGSGYRIYFGYMEQEAILLLVGGDKSSQTRDIEKAKRFWQDYKRSTEL